MYLFPPIIPCLLLGEESGRQRLPLLYSQAADRGTEHGRSVQLFAVFALASYCTAHTDCIARAVLSRQGWNRHQTDLSWVAC